MTALLDRLDVTALTDEELAAAFGEDGADIDALVSEASRRRAADTARRKARAARQNSPDYTEWANASHAQYMEAEQALQGNLVRRGSKVTDAWALWSGTQAWAEANATEELRNWWLGHERITISQVTAQRRNGQEVNRNDDMDRDVTDRVRREDGADRESPRVRQERAGHALPAAAARVEAQERQASARSAARPGLDIRPGGGMTETGERCPHTDPDVCTHKSPAGIRMRAERAARARPTGLYGAPAEVAVREESAVAYAPGAVPVAFQRPDLDGGEVLAYIRKFLARFAVWPSEAALNAAVLWVAQAHAKDESGLPIWQYAARFLLVSREGGSGKSWIGRLMAHLCPDGKSLIEPTKASLMSLIAKHCTVVLTEADVLFGTGKRNQGIVAVANGGYEPDHVHTHKQGGKDVEVPLFGPMIIDGLDTLITATGNELKTLVSRCIIVHVRRAPDGYRAPRFDREARAIAEIIGQRASRWMAQEVRAGIGDIVPELPEGVGNRAAAIWEPLIAVADAAGGDWPVLAREACVLLESAAGLPDEQEQEDQMLGDFFSAEGSEGDEWA